MLRVNVLRARATKTRIFWSLGDLSLQLGVFKDHLSALLLKYKDVAGSQAKQGLLPTLAQEMSPSPFIPAPDRLQHLGSALLFSSKSFSCLNEFLHVGKMGKLGPKPLNFHIISFFFFTRLFPSFLPCLH